MRLPVAFAAAALAAACAMAEEFTAASEGGKPRPATVAAIAIVAMRCTGRCTTTSFVGDRTVGTLTYQQLSIIPLHAR